MILKLTKIYLIAMVFGCALLAAHADPGKDAKPAKPAKQATPLTADRVRPSDHRAKGAKPAQGAKPNELERKTKTAKGADKSKQQTP